VNTWGKVERREQEPCLLVIGGVAQGLRISTRVLMDLEDRPSGNSTRIQINDLLDLCDPDQLGLSLRMVKAIFDHRTSKNSAPKAKSDKPQ
jgi:hypothetical protein